ncbi:hypothetical protein ACFLQ5_01940 [Bacteroidota bacterium]
MKKLTLLFFAFIICSFISGKNTSFICMKKSNNLLHSSAVGKSNTNGNVVKVFVKDGNIFAVYSSSKTKQLTYMGSDTNPILLDTNTVIYIREKQSIYGSDDLTLKSIMIVNINTLIETIITNKQPYIDGLNGTDEFLLIDNLQLSLDTKYVYFLANKYATSAQLVKVEISTGKWFELFPANSYEYIIKGNYKGLFFITSREIVQNSLMDVYKIVNEEGNVKKEFKDYQSAKKFLNENL